MKPTLNPKWLGVLLVIEGLLIFVPMTILGQAINWPDILEEPASIVLPTIFENASQTTIGYFSYLIYSILFFPVIALLAFYSSKERFLTPLLWLAAAFGALSAIARSIGIIRWLSVMPALSLQYNEGDQMTKETIALVFDAVNVYGGSIGEDLGVSLFASLSVMMLAIHILKSHTLPRWTGWFGVIASLAIAVPSLAIFDINVDPFVIASVGVVQFWFLFLGIYLLMKKGHEHTRA